MNAMKNWPIWTVGVAALAGPALGQAVELADGALELYGKAHVSLDRSDADASGESGQTGVSDNSSRIGFRGDHAINRGTTLLWQYEQNVSLTGGNADGAEFGTRNSFLGLAGSLGEVRVGHHDTPSKKLGSAWALFGDTVGDRRAIFGAYSGYGNVMNDRADNAIQYANDFGPLAMKVMYSSSNKAKNTTDAGLDDNDHELGSGSLIYADGPLVLGGAVEQWSRDPESQSEQVDNVRLMARYTGSRFGVGAIHESTSSDDGVYDRDALGVNGRFRLREETEVRAQYMEAGDHDDADDSGARQLALGLFEQLDPDTEVYAVYSRTDNEDNAEYKGIDGGHGDEMSTDPGGSPNALSVGLVHRF